MIKFWALFRFENLKQIFARFPLSVILILMISGTLVWLQNEPSHQHNLVLAFFSPHLEKLVISLIWMFFLSVGVALAVENSKLALRKKYLFQIIPLVLGILFFSHMDGNFYDSSPTNSAFILISFVGAFMFLFAAPYLTLPKIGNNIYYQYFQNLTQVFLFGFVLGGLMFGLGGLAILSLQLLFDIGYSLQGELISHRAIISLSLITPIICLMKLPKDTEK
jgi:hypothetical protein